MTAKHKTQISHVDLDKAFTNIRDYPGAHIDRKVFTIIAEHADDEGVARFTTRMSKLLYRVLGDDDISNSYGISNSLYRLVRKGIIKGASYSFDNFHYPHGTVTIAPGYMLHTATMPEPSDGTKRIQSIEKRLDHLTKVVANDDSEKEIVSQINELIGRIGKLEHDNRVLRYDLKHCFGNLVEPLGELPYRQSFRIRSLLEEFVSQL